ncbi:MAG: 23S rRNA (adenine(2503)-C(2))-methyltransferase RlmN, partial [Marinilabiliales bacterium]
STDGTRKYLFPFKAGYTETAMIPGEKRITVCVSSQSGCKFNCSFCATGAGGFHGQLSSGEILEQLFSIDEHEDISNIVYMGMGEPLDNMDAVLNSIEVLTSDWGKAMSPGRITISTIGIPSKLNEFLERSNVSIAISLHSPFPEEREELIPAQKSFPLEDIIKVLRKHKFTQHRRLTFEYIIFKGKNHSYKHARAMGELLRGLNVRVNLIPYNPVPTLPLQSPENYIMEQFRKELELQHITCTIRNSRGQDIEAACGMLAGKENNKQ